MGCAWCSLNQKSKKPYSTSAPSSNQDTASRIGKNTTSDDLDAKLTCVVSGTTMNPSMRGGSNTNMSSGRNVLRPPDSSTNDGGTNGGGDPDSSHGKSLNKSSDEIRKTSTWSQAGFGGDETFSLSGKSLNHTTSSDSTAEHERSRTERMRLPHLPPNKVKYGAMTTWLMGLPYVPKKDPLIECVRRDSFIDGGRVEFPNMDLTSQALQSLPPMSDATLMWDH
eukprot:PhF_6_TR10149/c0_g1_i1/m.15763